MENEELTIPTEWMDDLLNEKRVSWIKEVLFKTQIEEDVRKVGIGKIFMVLTALITFMDLNKNVLVGDGALESYVKYVSPWQIQQAIKALEKQGILTVTAKTGQPTKFHLEIGE